MRGLETSFTAPVQPLPDQWLLAELLEMTNSAVYEDEQPPELPQELIACIAKTTQPIPEVIINRFYISICYPIYHG